MLRSYVLFAVTIPFIMSCETFGELEKYIRSSEEVSQRLGTLETKIAETEKNLQQKKLDAEKKKEVFSENTLITENDCQTKFGGWDNVFDITYPKLIGHLSPYDRLKRVRCYYEVESKKDKSILEKPFQQNITFLYIHNAFKNVSYTRYTPLMAAISEGDIDLIRYLLKKGAKIFPGKNQYTNNANVFHILSAKGYDGELKLQIFQLLIEEIKRRGLSLSQEKQDQIEETKNKLINTVLVTKPTPNRYYKPSMKKTCASNYATLPITLAICNREDALLSKLIKEGANVNLYHDLPEKDDADIIKYKQISPLHIASQFGTFESVKILVKNKAELNAITKIGTKRYTPLDLVPTEEGLIEHYRDGYSRITYYYDYRYRNNAQIREFLISKGAKFSSEIPIESNEMADS